MKLARNILKLKHKKENNQYEKYEIKINEKTIDLIYLYKLFTENILILESYLILMKELSNEDAFNICKDFYENYICKNFNTSEYLENYYMKNSTCAH